MTNLNRLMYLNVHITQFRFLTDCATLHPFSYKLPEEPVDHKIQLDEKLSYSKPKASTSIYKAVNLKHTLHLKIVYLQF